MLQRIGSLTSRNGARILVCPLSICPTRWASGMSKARSHMRSYRGLSPLRSRARRSYGPVPLHTRSGNAMVSGRLRRRPGAARRNRHVIRLDDLLLQQPVVVQHIAVKISETYLPCYVLLADVRQRKSTIVLCQNCVRCPSKPRSNTVIYGDTPMHIVVAG